MRKSFSNKFISSLISHTWGKWENNKWRERTVEVLNTLISNIVSNLNNAEYNNWDRRANERSYLVMKATVKYRSHPIIARLKKECQRKTTFSFSSIEKKTKFSKKFYPWEAPKYAQNLSSLPKWLKGMFVFPTMLINSSQFSS